MPAPDLTAATLRANPAYELVPFAQLPPGEQRALHALTRDADFYGILRPRDAASRLGVKSVCRETALLFDTLREPGGLPGYLRPASEEVCAELWRLLLDGVLELRVDDGYVSGPAAHGMAAASGDPPATGRIARLSVAAVRYGQALELSNTRRLSEKLYSYGRQPLSPHWIRTLGDPDLVARHLGLHRGVPHREWIAAAGGTGPDPWLRWARRGAPAHGAGLAKLYVSVVCADVGSALRVTAALAAGSSAAFLKVGGDPAALLRPDKLMVYFWNLDDLREFACALSGELAGCGVQGVPFTAELAGDGLLSWGMDPPPDESVPAWLGQESWRLWITNRLAVALTGARAAAEPWLFALDRLRLDGVDTGSWTPIGAGAAQ
ncbi:hypothetical protein DFJ67_5966 [Asanoa ferruginea]|uniref:Uncharacterized protein n=1 Tax=Asanoa ferruginea TaxID=53367 RepID=A0A3E0A149_9ACTN|nr:hypothetical protein [Asanoa ferruginea]REF99920.1 hypothetical protein DFJ67_5966 [Asanoa ferruginea]GIF51618.1 hypothetical protein Afe04nite_61570 [Asanoa ferruginea]